jgi:tetratricopeptide (TPR) repeat protein
MEKADAFSAYDKMQIKQLVLNHLGGYSKLNESMIGAIREFCIKKSLFAVSIMTEEEKASSSLLENTGVMLSDLGDLDTALQLYSKALQLKEERPGHSDSDVRVADTYINMGNVYQRQGKLEKALEMYEKALEIFLTCLGDSHESVAATEDNIGIVLIALCGKETTKTRFFATKKLLTSDCGASARFMRLWR